MVIIHLLQRSRQPQKQSLRHLWKIWYEKKFILHYREELFSVKILYSDFSSAFIS